MSVLERSNSEAEEDEVLCDMSRFPENIIQEPELIAREGIHKIGSDRRQNPSYERLRVLVLPDAGRHREDDHHPGDQWPVVKKGQGSALHFGDAPTVGRGSLAVGDGACRNKPSRTRLALGPALASSRI